MTDPTSRGSAVPLPERVETVFLDAGNTLISMDYPRIAGVLTERGITCDAAAIYRAEAASRPAVSGLLERGGSTENSDTFRYYVAAVVATLQAVLEHGATSVVGADAIPGGCIPPADEPPAFAALVDSVTAALRPGPGESSVDLWCLPLPGAQEALRILREAGFELAVVSNSDGTIEEGLARVGLRDLVGAVFDSRVVGVEKPDPAIFAHAVATVGADAATTLYVGDIYAVDVVGARHAGLSAVLLDPFGDWGSVDCPKSVDLLDLARRLTSKSRP